MTANPLQPLMDALRSAWPQADSTSLATMADQLLRGQSATLGSSTAALTFGQGNDFREATISIGPIAGGNMTQITINFPQPINPQAAVLQQLLYHHESATIFANRLDTFVGREAEIAAIRQHIAQIMPTGGYVTITAQAGEGKSSVIARMVSQDGPDQTAFHFIALTPGREYQLSLLRPIVARLILKYGLSTTYFPGESYPAMRDYFHVVLRQLSEHGIQEVIYIDGLDQLKREGDGERDLSFLPTRPPPGIVLVLGTRPDDTLHPLQTLKPSEYRLPHLRFLDFQQLLVEQQIVTAAAQRLYSALQGNAFYLALVVQELKAGPIADLDGFINSINANPENLFGLTIERLRQDRTLWREVLQPILTLLLVAQEPLGIAAMRSLLDVGDADVRTGLQRLGGLVAQDSEGRSFLYHLKVRDYLEEDTELPDQPFVVSLEQIGTWHRKLAAWCLPNEATIDTIWEPSASILEEGRRHYARHHIITHLAAGQQYDRMWLILENGGYGRHKRRFDPSTRLYALDLDRARDVAVQTDDLSRLWRWSLLRVSLTSQIDAWPNALFLALVHLGRGNEALSRAELLSDSCRKVQVLGQLAPLFDTETAQRVWDRARATAAIIHTRERTRVLRTLAVAQAKALHPDAASTFAMVATATVAISHDLERINALRALATDQAHAKLWAEAQTTAAAINHAEERSRALNALATSQAQTRLWAEAQTTAATITDVRERASALGSLAAAQAQAGLWAEAQITIAAISDDWAIARALSALVAAQAQAGLWAEAQITIAAIPNDGEHARALSALVAAQAQAGLWAEAQITVAAISNAEERVRALSILATAQAKALHPDAPATFALAATEITAIDYTGERTRALSVLAAAQGQVGLQTEAQTTIAAIADGEERVRALQDLAIVQAQAGLWTEAQITAAAITHVGKHAQTLSILATAQAQALHPDAAATFVLATTAAAITDAGSVAHALRALAEAQIQAMLWTDAQITIDAITDAGVRARALCILATAQAQTGLWTEAQTTIATITDAGVRVSTLRILATAQAQAGLWAEAQTTIAAITNVMEHTSALRALAAAQAQAGLWAEAQTTIAAITNDWTISRALNTLAASQTQVGLWAEAQITIAGIIHAGERARALKTLAIAQAQAGLWAEAQTTAAAITDNVARASTLCALAAAQVRAGLWAEAQITATAITDAGVRARALRDIAVAQFQARHPDTTATFVLATTATAAISYDGARAEALCALATVQAQTGLWAEAQITATAIADAGVRARALHVLATAQAQHPDAAATFALATTAAAAITDAEVRARALHVLATAQAQAGLWAEAQTTATAITDAGVRARALRDIAAAQSQAQHPEAAATFALATTAAAAIGNDGKRATVLNELHGSLLHAENIPAIRRSTAATWRAATTRDTLLTMAIVAYPLVAHHAVLGREMVTAFIWVDAQLHDT